MSTRPVPVSVPPLLRLAAWITAVAMSLAPRPAAAPSHRSPHAPARFAAAWIPVAIIALGAAAMTIYCVGRGYSGWEFALRRKHWVVIYVSARCV